jgi:hypothetical protein
MDSVEESLRGLLAHSVPRPGPEPDPATSAAFGQLLSQATLARPDTPLDYRLAAPKWQFLCHAADHGGYVLHGPGPGDGEPRYFFSVNEDALDHEPWRAGTVYLLPADGFCRAASHAARRPVGANTAGGHRHPVRPAAKLSVEPADFPLLASIRGHDTRLRVTR